MKLLILKKFNNYFNRKIIKYDEIEDYAAAASSSLVVNDYNFNPNDAVRTVVVLGLGQVGEEHFFDFEKTNAADYLVCFTTETLHNGDEPDVDIHTIESRWFITEVKRTRGGQYEIQLKRDSIADNFNTLINCPAYIQKGICRDDSPLILNDEGISVNQIKKGQEQLKDETGSAWIIGYMPKDAGTQDTISAQVADVDVDFVTIEDLADELEIDATDLSSVLTDNPGNIKSFSNDNVEIDFYEYEVSDAITTFEHSWCVTTQNEFKSFTHAQEKSVSINNN